MPRVAQSNEGTGHMNLFRRTPEGEPELVPQVLSTWAARENSELRTMEALQRARRAHEKALDLSVRAQRAMVDAEAAHAWAQREVRRIAEAKPRPPHAS